MPYSDLSPDERRVDDAARHHGMELRRYHSDGQPEIYALVRMPREWLEFGADGHSLADCEAFLFAHEEARIRELACVQGLALGLHPTTALDDGQEFRVWRWCLKDRNRATRLPDGTVTMPVVFGADGRSLEDCAAFVTGGPDE